MTVTTSSVDRARIQPLNWRQKERIKNAGGPFFEWQAHGTTSTATDVREVSDCLAYVRHLATEKGFDALGSHQIDAHWSLAFACKEAPTTWELYWAVFVHSIPCTDFFRAHSSEIQDAMIPHADWKVLKEQSKGKISKVRLVQFYDWTVKRWLSINVPAVDWFDARESYRASLEETEETYIEKVQKNLTRFRRLAEENRSPNGVKRVKGYERFARDGVPRLLARFAQSKEDLRQKLQQLDSTPDFTKALFRISREAENAVRAAKGIAAVGEGWVSETELLYRVRSLFPDVEVVAHARPRWLAPQHLDILLPDWSVAIEYQGVQHLEPVKHFGGEEGFRRRQELDRRKRDLCEKHGVRLVEIAYDQEIDPAQLKLLITVSRSAN
jgi:hypothetical protein